MNRERERQIEIESERERVNGNKEQRPLYRTAHPAQHTIYRFVVLIRCGAVHGERRASKWERARERARDHAEWHVCFSIGNSYFIHSDRVVMFAMNKIASCALNYGLETKWNLHCFNLDVVKRLNILCYIFSRHVKRVLFSWTSMFSYQWEDWNVE